MRFLSPHPTPLLLGKVWIRHMDPDRFLKKKKNLPSFSKAARVGDVWHAHLRVHTHPHPHLGDESLMKIPLISQVKLANGRVKGCLKLALQISPRDRKEEEECNCSARWVHGDQSCIVIKCLQVFGSPLSGRLSWSWFYSQASYLTYRRPWYLLLPLNIGRWARGEGIFKCISPD